MKDLRPEDMLKLLTSMAVVADLVEAFANPDLQRRYGWNLAKWSWESIPWGVRFFHHGEPEEATTVVAVGLPEAHRAAFPSPWVQATGTTIVLLLA